MLDMAGEGRMVDVFISYARENQNIAGRIAEAVKREGYSVF